MKIILTESQSDDLIKSILKQYGIKQSFGYKQRSYNGAGQQIDTVYVWFDLPDNYTYQRMIDFKTKGYKVIGVKHHSNFFNVVDELNYLPKDVVDDYFINGAKTYLEKILPFEHIV
jgi:hypothetical protein